MIRQALDLKPLDLQAADRWLKRQPRLATEARQILRDYRFLGMLRRRGRAEVVGSIPLGLVITKDLDILPPFAVSGGSWETADNYSVTGKGGIC